MDEKKILKFTGEIEQIDMFEESYTGLQEQNLINNLLTEFICKKIYKPNPCVDTDAMLAIKCLCDTSKQIDTYLNDFHTLLGF